MSLAVICVSMDCENAMLCMCVILHCSRYPCCVSLAVICVSVDCENAMLCMCVIQYCSR